MKLNNEEIRGLCASIEHLFSTPSAFRAVGRPSRYLDAIFAKLHAAAHDRSRDLEDHTTPCASAGCLSRLTWYPHEAAIDGARCDHCIDVAQAMF